MASVVGATTPTPGEAAPAPGGFGRQMLRNSLALLAVQIVSWGLTFAVTLVLPRYLGTETTGTLFLVLSLVTLVELAYGLAHSLLAVKTIARDPATAGHLLSNMLTVRLVVAPLALLLFPLALLLTGQSPEFIRLAMIASVAGVLLGTGELIGAGYQGLQWMGLSSLLAIVVKTLTAAGTLALVFAGRPVEEVVAVGIPLGLLQVATMLLILHRRGHRLARPNLAGVRLVLIGSLPFLLSGATMVIYSQLNTVLLGLLSDARAVASYGIAMRLFGTMMVVPGMLIGAAFPLLTRLQAVDQAAMLVQARRLLVFFLVCSTLPALLLGFFAAPLVATFYGPDFAATAPVLQVVGLILVATYLNTFVGRLLQVLDREGLWAGVMIAVTVLALPINWLAISLAPPGTAAVGAAVGLLITEMAMTIPGFIILCQYRFGRVSLLVLGKGVLAALAAAVALALLTPVAAPLGIVVGGLAYAAVAWWLRIVPREDLWLAWGLARGLLGRFWPRRSRAMAEEVRG